MKENGKFGDFNVSKKRKIDDIMNKEPSLLRSLFQDEKNSFIKSFASDYPDIYFLLTDTTSYYEKKFGGLINKILREKRKMEFETPNRVLLTYEYELQQSTENKLKNVAYYLFNTRDRLSWLTIYADSVNTAIASQKQVKDLLSRELMNEINKLTTYLRITQEELVDFLYDKSDGKPCFIFCKSNVKSIKICYYDSVQEPEEKKSGNIIKFFSPIIEKEIKYTYRTLAPISNCWFYTRAPKNFYLNVNCNKKNVEIDKQASQDPEISSLVIKGISERQNVPFSIDVIVPDGLKYWYVGIYYVSFVTIVLKVIFIFIGENSCNGIFPLIAALITTRGWLMNESHSFNFLSKAYTCFVVVLMIEAFFIEYLIK